MKTKPSTEYDLLGALMSGSKHGYEIMQFLGSELDSTWYVSMSQLYTLLKRLEKNRFLKASIQEQSTRPSKRVYSLTPDGERHFMDWLYSPVNHVRDFRIEFVSKLFFFHSLSLSGGTTLINKQVEIMKELKKKMATRLEDVKTPFNRLVLGFKVENAKSLLLWLSSRAKLFMMEAEKNANISQDRGQRVE